MSRGKALIVGAGIAGPVAALALRRSGIEAEIYEAYPTTAHGVGAFMGLAVNGLDGLESLGVLRDVQAVGVATPRMAMLNGAGKVLAETPNGLTLDNGNVGLTIERAKLYHVLHDAALRRGVPVHYGKRLHRFEDRGRSVIAHFADGTSAEGSVLIGADGMRSKVRELVDPKAPPPEFIGLIGTGGYARNLELAIAPGTFYFAFGKRAFLGYMQLTDDLIGWFANEPCAREPSAEALLAISPDMTRARLLDLFAGDNLPARALLDASTEIINPMSMHCMAAPQVWHRERMVLIGDAAHVTSPSSGQGASLAIEDAVVLARCLRDLPDHRAAFVHYQSLREARVQKVYASAKRVNSSKAAGPIGRMFRDLMLPFFAKQMASPKAMAWLHGHHIDFDSPVAPAPAPAKPQVSAEQRAE